MRRIIPPLFVYVTVCIVVVLSRASDGYNEVGWKLLVAQLYAIPLAIIVALVTFFVNKKFSRK